MYIYFKQSLRIEKEIQRYIYREREGGERETCVFFIAATTLNCDTRNEKLHEFYFYKIFIKHIEINKFLLIRPICVQ